MENVFKRTDYNSSGLIIKDNVYNLILGSVLCWGFFINWLMVKNIPYGLVANINPLLFFIGYLVCCLAGVSLFTGSKSPLVSFIGYNLVVIPFGFIINLVVHQYDPAIVVDALRVTGMVTILMMFLGAMFPVFFQRISGALGIALLAVIIIEFVEIVFFKMHHGILDWVVVMIFCGYIGYDWGRANRIPKTVDNAVDSAAALYMDIINLFLRILRIMGRRR